MTFTPDQLEAFKSFRFSKLMEFLRHRDLIGSKAGDRYAAAQNLQVRLRAARTLGFGPRDIMEVEQVSLPDGRDMIDVRVAFMGLYGPASPLPPAYSEWVIQDGRDVIPIEDFLDFFNHTMIFDVDVIWRKFRHELRYQPGATDPLSRREAALAGLAPQVEPDAQLPERRLLLPQIGLAAMYSRSANTVAAIIAHYFQVGAHVEEFVERTVSLPPDQMSRLGVEGTDLGGNFVLGEQLADKSGKFTLHLGPLSNDAFEAFLPGGKFHAILITFVGFLVRDPLEWDMRLSLQSSEVGQWSLGERRLGWTTWMDADARQPCRMSIDPWPDYAEDGLAG